MSNTVTKYVEHPVDFYNQNTGDRVLALPIKCTPMQTRDGKKWLKVEVQANYKSFYTFKEDVVLTDIVKDGKYVGEGNFKDLLVNVGPRSKWTQMSFLDSAFDNVEELCSVKSQSKLSTGVLYVRAKGVDKKSWFGPYLDKEGNIKYTKVWIKSDIVGFEALVADQSSFGFAEDHPVVQEAEYEETPCDDNGVVEEETQTEETTF